MMEARSDPFILSSSGRETKGRGLPPLPFKPICVMDRLELESDAEPHVEGRAVSDSQVRRSGKRLPEVRVQLPRSAFAELIREQHLLSVGDVEEVGHEDELRALGQLPRVIHVQVEAG